MVVEHTQKEQHAADSSNHAAGVTSLRACVLPPDCSPALGSCGITPASMVMYVTLFK